MVIPCLCLFVALSSLFSELVGAKPLHLLTQTVLLLAQTSNKQKRTQTLFIKNRVRVQIVWWSIVNGSRTFRRAYHCCGQSASNQETAALRNASALVRVLFSVGIPAGQCCPADHADSGRLHSNRRRTVCRLR